MDGASVMANWSAYYPSCTVRPDLAIFCHFGNILKTSVKFVRVYLCLEKF